MTQPRPYIGCSALGDTNYCCDSCHEDQELGYGMCEDASPDNTILAVYCCKQTSPRTMEEWSAALDRYQTRP